MPLNLALTDLDRCIWDEELADFVPDRLYDAHTHVYDLRQEIAQSPDAAKNYAKIWTDFPLANWSMLDQIDRQLLPGRQVHRVCFGNPFQNCPLDQANAFTAAQVAADPLSVGLLLVQPQMSPDELLDQARRYNLCGLKPYRMHSVTGDPVECRITDFLPEPQLAAADQRHMMVMLHLSKTKAIADPDNLADLERLTVRYPRVQWVLAHCARSYYDRPLLKARNRLREIPNLWFEISSVCDSDAMDVLLALAGPDRVMYGSDDIPVGVTRGKYITFGHGWAALTEENHNFTLPHCDGRLTFTRYESLRAFGRAVRRQGYGKEEIQKLFFHNAQQLITAVRQS